MQHKRYTLRPAIVAAAFLALAALFLLLSAPTEAAPAREESAPAAWEVIATGLANPRHLTFGPDGALYVAESGSGGEGVCIPDPEGGNRCLGDTGAISKVTFDAGMAPTGQTQVITGVPSLAHEDTGANATGGPTDVAFLGTDMYFTTGFAGDPAVLLPAGPLGADGANFARIMSAGPGDAFTSWADLGAFEAAENPTGDEEDTNPFSLETVGDDFILTDAGANSLLSLAGGTAAIDVVATFPNTMVEFPPGSGMEMPMDAVPTSVVVGPDGAYYVSQLTGFPFPVGGASIWRVEAGGDPEMYAGGFTNILDLDFAADGSLYVLEMFTRSMLSGDPTGAITRIDPDGSRTLVAREGLITPTGLTIGPDHALYVSNIATSATDGQVVRIPTKLSEAADFVAILSGDDEVPPVTTGSTGVGKFHLAEDGTLSWAIAVRDIEDITAAHIHKGAPGESGPPVITLFPDGADPFDPENPLTGSAMLTAEQIADLLAGNYYVNVHTPTNPGGQIRGQIGVSRTWAFWAKLDGASEVPPVATGATGRAYFTLSADLSELHYRVKVWDLPGITASHIHEAPAGSNGGVVFPLFMGGPPPFDEDNPVSGTLNPDISQVAALLAGDYYVNVHTTAHASGEIRGQIGAAMVPTDYEAHLSGNEEVPPVATAASGHATFALSADLSTVDFHLAVNNIDKVNAAHLHPGWRGTNGPVAHPLFAGGPPPLEPGSPVNGLLAFGAQDVLDLWTGYYYVNVHTTDFPSGEIRGQVEELRWTVYLPFVAR